VVNDGRHVLWNSSLHIPTLGVMVVTLEGGVYFPGHRLFASRHCGTSSTPVGEGCGEIRTDWIGFMLLGNEPFQGGMRNYI